MRRERDEAEQLFRTTLPLAPRAKRHAYEELLQPCGRFRPLLSAEEKLRIRTARFSDSFDILQNNTVTLVPSLPLNWQFLLRYLHRENVLPEPFAYYPSYRNDEPKTFSFFLSDTLSEKVTDGYTNDQGGNATASTAEEALSKAVGELLERHFLGIYRLDALYTMPFSQLKKKALDPSALCGFLPWQKEAHARFRYEPDMPLRWVKGTDLMHGASAYLPAQLVFWNYTYPADEPILSHSTTNGGAGHFTVEEATASALIELIQRDSFLVYWLNSLAPRRIDAASAQDAELQELLETCRRYKLQPHFLDTTSDINVPSCVCVLTDTAAEPFIAMGAGTGFAVRETLTAALRESLSVFSFTSRMARFELPEDYKPFTHAKIGRNERLCLWRGHEMFERFSFFISGASESVAAFLGKAPRLEQGERLPYLIGALKEKDYDVYRYEVRDPVLDKLGYHVVRVIVPQLVPLYLHEHMATLDAKRLREVPARLGHAPADTPNPWPHPFP